jgi:hypothetical protein
MNLEEQLAAYRKTYYDSNQKNTIFKKAQKMDCAKQISQNFSLQQLLDKSVYIVENSNFIYIDYPLIKQYLCPDTYDSVSNHILKLNEIILKLHTHFNLRVDLKTFSVTAGQRYNDLIKRFCSLYLDTTDDSNSIERIEILNRPAIMEVLFKMFNGMISKESRDKVVFIK